MIETPAEAMTDGTTGPMITVERLTKTFGARRALADLSFDVAPRACLGVLGGNGSGKSTLLRVLATLVAPSSGHVRIAGLDVVTDIDRIRSRIAYADGTLLPADGVRVAEYLDVSALARYRSRATARAAVTQALSRAGFEADDDVATLTAGARARLALCAALCAPPDLLLLDDPLHDIDRAARAGFMQWIDERHDAGATVVVAAETLSGLPACCHRTIRLERGSA